MAKTHEILDKIGITASSICAVHCALAPLLITIAPLIGLGFLFEEKFETTFILMTFGIAFLSLIWGFYKNHQNFLPIYVLLLGAALITISRMGPLKEVFPEPVFMALGGMSIAVSHFINMQLCNHCHDCEDH